MTIPDPLGVFLDRWAATVALSGVIHMDDRVARAAFVAESMTVVEASVAGVRAGMRQANDKRRDAFEEWAIAFLVRKVRKFVYHPDFDRRHVSDEVEATRGRIEGSTYRERAQLARDVIYAALLSGKGVDDLAPAVALAVAYAMGEGKAAAYAAMAAAHGRIVNNDFVAAEEANVLLAAGVGVTQAMGLLRDVAAGIGDKMTSQLDKDEAAMAAWDAGIKAAAAAFALGTLSGEYAAAMVAAFMDAGVSEVNWVTEDNPCSTCLAIEQESPYKVTELPELPVHINCRCSIEPVGRPDLKTVTPYLDKIL